MTLEAWNKIKKLSLAGKEGSAVLRGIVKKEETGNYLCANRKNQWRKNQDTEQSE